METFLIKKSFHQNVYYDGRNSRFQPWVTEAVKLGVLV